MCALLCIFSPFASGADFYGTLERKRERHICQKNQCQFSSTTNCCWGMPLNMFYCLLLKWNLWKKGHFYILFFTLMYWHTGRSIHDWAKVTELHSWCIGYHEAASCSIINSNRTKRNTQFSLEVFIKITVLFPERIQWLFKSVVRFCWVTRGKSHDMFWVYLNPAKFYHFCFTDTPLFFLFLATLSSAYAGAHLQAPDQTKFVLLLLEHLWISQHF